LNSPDFQPEQTSHSVNVDKSNASRPEWSLTQDAFDKLLNSFSSDREQAALEYEMTRRKLIRFFQSRYDLTAEERADETINRVTRRISEGQQIDNLLSYFYGVARMVLRESQKEKDRIPVPLDDEPQSQNQKMPEQEEPDVMFNCFDRCMDALAPESRQLILDYYQEERGVKIQLRRELADRLHIPLNALRIRAHRIRISLEDCINSCLQRYGAQSEKSASRLG
jgi:DNA-directed RNA polymerase specialized sigma24 family protein